LSFHGSRRGLSAAAPFSQMKLSFYRTARGIGFYV